MSTALRPVAPVGEKADGIAHRAALDVIDGVVRKPDPSKLSVHDASQIDVRALPATRDHGRIGRRRGEPCCYLVRHFERLKGNVGTDRGEQIAGIPQRLTQPFDRGSYHSADDAAPARMNRERCATSPIAHQNGNTVGGAHAAGEVGVQGNHCIAFVTEEIAGFLAAIGDVARGSVDLRQEVHPLGRHAEGGGSAPEIFGHVLTMVSHRHREAQGRVRPLRHATTPGEEGVPESSALEEWTFQGFGCVHRLPALPNFGQVSSGWEAAGIFW